MTKIFLFIATLFLTLSSYQSFATSPVMCTMDVKMCSDGVTYLGRTGPSCEFETCPNTSTAPKICTREYMPVCGQPKMPLCPEGMMCPMVMPEPITYGNTCTMEADGATLISKGECMGPEITPANLISPRIQTKIDTAVKNLTDKLDQKYTDTTEKSLVVYRIIERLNAKNLQNELIVQAIQYIIQSLETYNRSFQDQSSWGLPD